MEYNVLQVKIETVGFETASEKIKELTEDIRMLGIVAKQTGLRKRDVRKLVKLIKKKEKKNGRM